MTKPIPDNNGKVYANSNKINIRANLFKQYYVDVNSKTFCNITQSALKAGYSQEYAENISGRNPKWYQEMKEDAEFMRANMLKKAEKNLDKVLDSSPDDVQSSKLQVDVSKFVSERVGKDAYSTRKELTDKGGKRLFNNTHSKDSQGAIADLFINVDAETGV